MALAVQAETTRQVAEALALIFRQQAHIAPQTDRLLAVPREVVAAVAIA